MRGTPWWTGCALLGSVLRGSVLGGGVLWGCGEAPPAPTAVPESQRVGAGSKGQTEMDVLPVRPSPDSVMAVPTVQGPSEAASAPPVPAPAAESDPPSAPPPAVKAQVFSACQQTRLVGCDAVYVRMLASNPDLCVQLVMDNCIQNARQGLAVALPLSWRLSSGSASTNRGCDLQEYDPKSQPALTATGKISWSQRGRVISGLDIDISLSVESPPDSKVPAEIDVATDSPIASIEACD